MRILLSAFCLLATTLFSCQQQSPVLKMNQIQVIASHNSYKQPIEPALMQLLYAQDSTRFSSLDYQHLPLAEQLNLGIRKLELDIVHDPKGGRFAKPYGISLLQSQGIETLPYDTEGKMMEPGFKVLHVQDIDFRSNCLKLGDCLSELKAWSDTHPRHIPIAISFNAKSDIIEQPGFTQPLAFTKNAFDSLDREILSIIPKEQIILPDDIRGNYETLEAAVLDQNWPSLDEARGKFIFVLDEGGEKRATYMKDHPSLEGRVLFVNHHPGVPEAAFIIFNNPVANLDSIRSLVRMGYLVRTRADAGTKEARAGDYTRLEAALASGAQFISTDYYVPDPRFGTNYQVSLPQEGPARCNPINSTLDCPELITE